MKTFFVFVVLSISIATASQAQTNTTQDNLDKLFEIMEMDKTMEVMFSQMESIYIDNLKDRNLTAEQTAVYAKYHQEMTQVMMDEMSWDAMKVELRHVYLQNFTEQEIADILAFYQSPAGQSVLRTMPVVAQESMQIGQAMAQNAMPKLQALGKDLTEALEALEDAEQ
ncbi:DUF2059 domain-containing protein [Glaciecola sp. XM2]|jgi:hypothetical protein|uniref:DUF2059 domain-containing protein n=1 Tax=Glaciecola sp. XM2 TaxID=1914931 RepID=UPI001BDED87F|nr:DUF2059 domain-containing protein [Glaciecola sp. XM2]MBT1450328.1 DUF2059 domain-containing protein [Glaciecola sp. XM2]